MKKYEVTVHRNDGDGMKVAARTQGDFADKAEALNFGNNHAETSFETGTDYHVEVSEVQKIGRKTLASIVTKEFAKEFRSESANLTEARFKARKLVTRLNDAALVEEARIRIGKIFMIDRGR